MPLCVVIAAATALAASTQLPASDVPLPAGVAPETRLDPMRIAVLNLSDEVPRSDLDAPLLSRATPYPLGWTMYDLEPTLAADPQLLAGSNAHALVALASSAIDRGEAFVSPVLVQGDFELIPNPDIYVRFAKPFDFELFAAVVTAYELGAPLEAVSGFDHVYRFVPDVRDGLELLQLCVDLVGAPGVELAEPNFTFTGRGQVAPPASTNLRNDTMPNDPLFADQWGLLNVGQLGGTPGFDLNILPAWRHTTGSETVTVGVLDVGIDPNHPDLNLVPGFDFTGQGDSGEAIEPCDLHGTWVAGNVAARRNNNFGIAGAAPDIRVMSLRFAISFDSQPPCALDWVSNTQFTIDALNTAANLGVQITNNSNAYAQSNSLITEAYANTLEDGVAHFASAGNSLDGEDAVTYPARLASVAAVAAIDRTGARAFFSNDGGQVAVTAPGAELITTDLLGDAGEPGDFTLVNGTSFASGYVSGVAGLVASLMPDLAGIEIQRTLERSARDIDEPGRDIRTGFGLIDAEAALRLAATYRSWNPIDPAPLESPRGSGDAIAPAPRRAVALAHDPSRDVTVLFGGFVGASGNNETWEFDGERWTLRELPIAPSPRFGSAIAFDSMRDQLILFGGFAGFAPSDETWIYDAAGWQQVTTASGPSARFLHAMTYDATRDRVVLFGGRTNTFNAETWEFDPQTRTWAQRNIGLDAPSPRQQHALGFDAARDRTILFGGTQGANETWAWDGTAWTQLFIDGPTPRISHAMTYDTRRAEIVLFGGLNDDDEPLDDTWTLDNEGWAIRSASGPAPRSEHGLTYVASSESTLTFGGLGELDDDDEPLNDLWAWRIAHPDVAFVGPVADQIVEGAGTRLIANVGGVGALEFQWLRDGAPLAESSRISGTASAVLSIRQFGQADQGRYELQATDLRGTGSAAVELQVDATRQLGDANCDGQVTEADIDAFVTALLDPDAYAQQYPDCTLQTVDLNGDGRGNTSDIDPFVLRLEAL